MAFCDECGTRMQEEGRFCPSCGTGAGIAARLQAQRWRAYETAAAPSAPAQADIWDAQDNRAMAVLAYILFFVPLLSGAHRASAFVKYHANQGAVLFLFTLVWGVAYGVLTSVLAGVMLSGAWGSSVVSTLLNLIWLLPSTLCALGIINAAQGRMKPLPLIGKRGILK